MQAHAKFGASSAIRPKAKQSWIKAAGWAF